MAASNVSHGVITIDVKDIRSEKVAEALKREAFRTVTPGEVAPYVPPEPVIQYPITAPVAAEVAPQAEPEQDAAQPAA